MEFGRSAQLKTPVLRLLLRLDIPGENELGEAYANERDYCHRKGRQARILSSQLIFLKTWRRLTKAWTMLLFIKQLRRRTTELAFLPTFSMPDLIALANQSMA